MRFFLKITAVLIIMIFVLWIFYNQNNNKIANQEESYCAQPEISKKTVVIRVDDVQAFTWFETTSKMITDAREKGFLLTLGVIPAGIEYDKSLIEFLKENDCILEYALHGWDHSNGENELLPEFEILTEEQARQRINPGLKNLALITDSPIVTWIPPFNSQSVGTIAALKELGFKYLSSEGTGEWDYAAATFEYEGNTLVSPEIVIAECEKKFLSDKKCVIMMHPQDFTDGPDHNEVKYQEYYLDLLDEMKERGYTPARFKDFTENGVAE